MKKILLSTISLVTVVATSAFSADLPSRKEQVTPPPAFTWTGLYAGINVGYGFGNNAIEQGSMVESNGVFLAAWNQNQSPTGVVGGGQIGYNYQLTQWLVLGAEADIQASDMNSQRSYITTGIGYPGDRIFINSSNSIDWYGTARGRVGIAVPNYSNILVYGTGGFAYGYVNNTVGLADVWSFNGVGSGFSGSSTYGNTKVGWTGGGGIEWSPATFPAWSAKVEYLYTNLGSTNQAVYSNYSAGYDVGYSFLANHNTQTQFHSIRAGLNWHFNPFYSTPVVAKY